MGQGFESLLARHVVGVAQLVRVSGCGPEGREFESLHPPHFLTKAGVAFLLYWGVAKR